MITLLVSLCLIGFVAYILMTVVPMAAPVPQIISGVAALICVLMVLRYFGLLSGATF